MVLHDISDIYNIAKRAGHLIMQVYNDYKNLAIKHKEDSSPLTIADIISNNLIVEELQKLHPVYPIVSEESKLLPYKVRKTYDHYWLIDPLDGTKEFINKNGEFTVNIALISHGLPVLGVVHLPANKITYYAKKGGGSFKIEDNKIEQIHACRFDLYDRELNVCCSRSHVNDTTQKIIDKLDAPKIMKKGSSLKITQIAEGLAHFYPRLGPTMEWDIAAAQIILEQAGGHVINYKSLEKLHYNKESLKNDFFFATGNIRDIELLKSLIY